MNEGCGNGAPHPLGIMKKFNNPKKTRIPMIMYRMVMILLLFSRKAC